MTKGWVKSSDSRPLLYASGEYETNNGQQREARALKGRVYRGGDGSLQGIAVGSDATESDISGKGLDDLLLTGDNLPTASFGSAVTTMTISGGGGIDTAILPGNKEDYSIIPASLSQMPGVSGEYSDKVRAMVLVINDPKDDGLKSIQILGDVERVVFSGSGAIDKLKELSKTRRLELKESLDLEGLREQADDAKRKHGGDSTEYKAAKAAYKEARHQYKQQTGTTPDDVQDLFKQGNMQSESFDDLYKGMMEGLTEAKRGFYDMMGSPDVRTNFALRVAGVKRLATLKSKPNMADTYKREMDIASGKEEGQISIYGKPYTFDPPLTQDETKIINREEGINGNFDPIISAVMRNFYQLPPNTEWKVNDHPDNEAVDKNPETVEPETTITTTPLGHSI